MTGTQKSREKGLQALSPYSELRAGLEQLGKKLGEHREALRSRCRGALLEGLPREVGHQSDFLPWIEGLRWGSPKHESMQHPQSSSLYHVPGTKKGHKILFNLNRSQRKELW